MATYSIRGVEEPPLPVFEGTWDVRAISNEVGSVSAAQVFQVHCAKESFIAELTVIQAQAAMSASGKVPALLSLPPIMPEYLEIGDVALGDLLALIADLKQRDSSWTARSAVRSSAQGGRPVPEVPLTIGPFAVDQEGNFVYYTDVETYRSLGLGLPFASVGRGVTRQLPKDHQFYAEPIVSFARRQNPLLATTPKSATSRTGELTFLANRVEKAIIGSRAPSIPKEVASLKVDGGSVRLEQCTPRVREWRFVRDPSIQLPPGADPFDPRRLQTPTLDLAGLERASIEKSCLPIFEDVMEFLGRLVCNVFCDSTELECLEPSLDIEGYHISTFGGDGHIGAEFVLQVVQEAITTLLSCEVAGNWIAINIRAPKGCIIGAPGRVRAATNGDQTNRSVCIILYTVPGPVVKAFSVAHREGVDTSA